MNERRLYLNESNPKNRMTIPTMCTFFFDGLSIRAPQLNEFYLKQFYIEWSLMNFPDTYVSEHKAC